MKKGTEGMRKEDRPMKHGIFSKILKPEGLTHLDRRTRFAKAVAELRRSLLADLGGDTSIQQNLLVERVISKALQCAALESQLLSGHAENRPFYISLSNSLRLDLLALGLSRKQVKVPDLNKYLDENYGENDNHTGD